MTTAKRPQGNQDTRRPWRRPELRSVGTLGEVLKSGTNKVTISQKDTFDADKPVTEA